MYALTIGQMLSRINLYLYESGKSPDGTDVFSPDFVLETLNGAQVQIVSRSDFPRGALSALDVDLFDQALLSGCFDISDLEYQPLSGLAGIDSVKFSENDDFCDLISYDEYIRFKREGFDVDPARGAYYIRGSKLCFLPEGTTGTIDLSYRREPESMTLAVGDDPAIDCELPYEVQRIVVEKAAAEIFVVCGDDRNASIHDSLGERFYEALISAYPVSDTIRRGVVRSLRANPLARRGGRLNRLNIYTGK